MSWEIDLIFHFLVIYCRPLKVNDETENEITYDKNSENTQTHIHKYISKDT